MSDAVGAHEDRSMRKRANEAKCTLGEKGQLSVIRAQSRPSLGTWLLPHCLPGLQPEGCQAGKGEGGTRCPALWQDGCFPAPCHVPAAQHPVSLTHMERPSALPLTSESISGLVYGPSLGPCCPSQPEHETSHHPRAPTVCQTWAQGYRDVAAVYLSLPVEEALQSLRGEGAVTSPQPYHCCVGALTPAQGLAVEGQLGADIADCLPPLRVVRRVVTSSLPQQVTWGTGEGNGGSGGMVLLDMSSCGLMKWNEGKRGRGVHCGGLWHRLCEDSRTFDDKRTCSGIVPGHAQGKSAHLDPPWLVP